MVTQNEPTFWRPDKSGSGGGLRSVGGGALCAMVLGQWWRNAKQDDLAMSHGDVMKYLFPSPKFLFPSQAAVLFVSNPRGAVPSPAARVLIAPPCRCRGHRRLPPTASELWLPPRM